LDGHIEFRNLESVEHNRGHFFSIFLGVHGGFSQKTGVFMGLDSEFILIAMMPDFFHFVPVVDDTMFNRVFKLQNTSLSLGFRSHINFFIFSTHHD